MGSSSTTPQMARMLLIFLAFSLVSSSYPHTIHIQLEMDTDRQSGSEVFTPNPAVDMCGYSQIVKCSDTIISAIVTCSDHHSATLTECIKEVLGGDSQCMDCVKTVCRKLHIRSCQ